MLVLLLMALLVAQDTDPTDLAIGDPARKERKIAVGVDRIVDTRDGAELTPADLVSRLANTRLLLIGETHTSRECHRVQRQVIEALQRARRPVIIALEMYPYTQQAWLDRWSRPGAADPALTEDAFVRGSAWYEHWSYHWKYYREIFVFAREHTLPTVAVNAPRDVVTAVRKRGFANLTPEEARHIPTTVDVDSADHLTLFKAYVGPGDATHGGGMSDAVWRDMLSAQATWDATMGFNAAQAWKAANDPRAIVVVLAGSGHVAYGLGIERQVRRSFEGEVTTLVPIAVEDDTPVQVRASYASIVWGVPAEPALAYPMFGVSTMVSTGKAGAGLQVIAVDDKSPAGRAGVKMGDVLLALDGQALTTREMLNRLQAEKDWGDVADLRIRRGTEEQTLRVTFRREFPSRELR